MRHTLRHWDVDQIKERLKIWFPGNKIDILLNCINFECGDNDIAQSFGEYPKFTEEFIEESDEFQSLWGDWRHPAERLWQGGQACVGVVCICDQRTPRRPSLVVSSTFHAICVEGGTRFIKAAPGPVQLYHDY